MHWSSSRCRAREARHTHADVAQAPLQRPAELTPLSICFRVDVLDSLLLDSLQVALLYLCCVRCGVQADVVGVCFASTRSALALPQAWP